MPPTGSLGVFQAQNSIPGEMGSPLANVIVSRSVCAAGVEVVRKQFAGIEQRCMREHAMERPG